MAAGFTFRSISKNQLKWHSDLGGDFREWLYLDGWMDNDYKYGLVLATKMEMGENVVGPEKGDWPLIDCLVTSPEGVTHRVSKAFPIEMVKPEPWGITMGDNVFAGALMPDGMPAGYRVIVPRECVGDRHDAPHDANLFDINAKYGDVVSKDDVITYLERIGQHRATATAG